jgi:hypothetical protein
MAIQNPIVMQLTNAITPIVSIGVGSSIWTVCQKLGLKADSLTAADLPVVKAGLMEHYQKFWSNKTQELKRALDVVKAA